MTRLMIVVGSVRDGRIGLPIAEWVRDCVEKDARFEVDWADLKEIGLPLMTEPNHPRLHQYTQQATIDWSDRVAAADAFVFVQPEYNYSYSPALKNALDHLSQRGWRKPLGSVRSGALSGATGGVAALRVPVTAVGLVPTTSNVEISWAAKQITDEGAFEPNEHQERMLAAQLDEIVALDHALAPLRAAHVR